MSSFVFDIPQAIGIPFLQSPVLIDPVLIVAGKEVP